MNYGNGHSVVNQLCIVEINRLAHDVIAFVHRSVHLANAWFKIFLGRFMSALACHPLSHAVLEF